MERLPQFVERLDPNIYLSNRWLVLDFETTNKDKGSALNDKNELVLWVARTSDGAYHSGNSNDVSSLLDLVRSTDFTVAHNAKFELQWLYRLGIEPGSILCYCTLLGEFCIAGNRKWDLSLDGSLKRYGLEGKESLVADMILGGVCPSEIPTKRLLEYCKQDVEQTYKLFQKQLPILQEMGLLPCFFTRNLVCLCLADIEANGMWLDLQRVNAEYRKALIESRTILGKLHEITGGINPNSAQQIGEFLYDNLKFQELVDYKKEPIRTPTGRRKADESTISALVPTTQAQREFLEVFLSYVPFKVRLATLTKLQECAQAEESLRFHLNQSVVSTHRLSSTGGKYKVQGQNIGRDLKPLFKARYEGWLVGEVDEAQVEFRAAGHLGNDDQIKDDIKTKKDIHRRTASVLLKKPQEEITKKERSDAKPRTFAPLFGSNSGTPDEKRYNKEFRRIYNQVNKTQKDWTYQVLKDKQLKTQTGLTFYWPACEMYKSGYIKYTTEIFNYPIQSLCGAEITPVGLVFCWYLMKIAKMRSFITNTIHDAGIFELHPEEVDEWKKIIKECFTKKVFEYLDRVYGIKFSVPLEISYTYGEHWTEGKEKTYEYGVQ